MEQCYCYILFYLDKAITGQLKSVLFLRLDLLKTPHYPSIINTTYHLWVIGSSSQSQLSSGGEAPSFFGSGWFFCSVRHFFAIKYVCDIHHVGFHPSCCVAAKAPVVVSQWELMRKWVRPVLGTNPIGVNIEKQKRRETDVETCWSGKFFLYYSISQRLQFWSYSPCYVSIYLPLAALKWEGGFKVRQVWANKASLSLRQRRHRDV